MFYNRVSHSREFESPEVEAIRLTTSLPERIGKQRAAFTTESDIYATGEPVIFCANSLFNRGGVIVFFFYCAKQFWRCRHCERDRVETGQRHVFFG